MAVTLRFSPEALVACRFAISPLTETMGAVRILAGASGTGYHAPWLRAIQPALESLDLTPLSLLAPRRTYGPDFLNPAPGTPGTSFAAELATVRATPAARVRREIDRCMVERFRNSPPSSARPLLGRGESARELCVETLEAAWRALVEPWWPRIHHSLEADIAYQSRLLADAGLTAVLTDLHPHLTWAAHVLHIDVRSEEHIAVGAEGIVLMPTVFSSLGVSYEPPSLNYEARGIASLWMSPAASPEPLRRLLGTRRADILINLDVPASTTGLAAKCHLPLSSISEHLTVLRTAGLTATHRTGRRLQHSRTPLGTALIEQSL
jgi:hypothetical protein